jgi:hypothetical protein
MGLGVSGAQSSEKDGGIENEAGNAVAHTVA